MLDQHYPLYGSHFNSFSFFLLVFPTNFYGRMHLANAPNLGFSHYQFHLHLWSVSNVTWADEDLQIHALHFVSKLIIIYNIQLCDFQQSPGSVSISIAPRGPVTNGW